MFAWLMVGVVMVGMVWYGRGGKLPTSISLVSGSDTVVTGVVVGTASAVRAAAASTT